MTFNLSSLSSVHQSPRSHAVSSLFAHQHTHRDLVRLKEFLANTLSKTGVLVPKSPVTETLELLNLACGRADETAVLADVFGKNSESLHMTGLDIRDREIGEANDRWKQLAKNTTTDFLVQDASKLSELHELSHNFDIAFMRHQNFWNGDTTWSKIYDQALHRLDENGLLVITSYFDREHKLALDAIQGLGAELVHTERNHNSRVLHDAPGKSVDRHVAIFRKP